MQGLLTADNGIVLHDVEVLAGKDVTATSGGDEDLALGGSLLHGEDLVTGNGGLESVDGVDFGDNDGSTHAAEGLGATLADVTVTSNDGDLTGNHDIGGTLDSVDEGFSASVEVVELGLGDGVVNVDGGDEELTALHHLVEVVDTGGGLLRDTIAVLEHLWVLLVDEGGQVTTVVKDEVELLSVLEGNQLLLKAPLVLFLGLTLPGEAIHSDVRRAGSQEKCQLKAHLHWGTRGSNGSSSMVLGGEDVAAGPGNLSTEGSEGLNEHGSLNGYKIVSHTPS